MNKQSSVEWLVEELQKLDLLDNAQDLLLWQKVREAREMHRQEIIEANRAGAYPDSDTREAEQYYNETFGGVK